MVCVAVVTYPTWQGKGVRDTFLLMLVMLMLVCRHMFSSYVDRLHGQDTHFHIEKNMHAAD